MGHNPDGGGLGWASITIFRRRSKRDGKYIPRALSFFTGLCHVQQNISGISKFALSEQQKSIVITVTKEKKNTHYWNYRKF